MKFTEEQVNRWAHPPSETEDERCENAYTQISDALKEHFGSKVFFIRQGSHRNRTNVKIDSDIDIAVIHDDNYFPGVADLSEADKLRHEANSKSTSYPFSKFKTDVYDVLKNKFGDSFVERKNKCIRVKGNSYRINADVVPAYEHIRFSSYGVVSATGIGFLTDIDPKLVYSFPEQHYENGVEKNTLTSKAFKAVVRILKNVRNKLIDDGIIDKDAMPSFFLECLVWNIPKEYFNNATWRADSESVALKIWSDMRNEEKAKNYAEISDLKWLFRGGTRKYKQAEDFMLQAWSYLKI